MKDERFRKLFKFVCLFNPTYETVREGEDYLEKMNEQGFKGKCTPSDFTFHISFFISDPPFLIFYWCIRYNQEKYRHFLQEFSGIVKILVLNVNIC